MRKPTEFENHPAGYEYARSIGNFRAVCKNVTDGDTIDAFIDLGMGKYAYDTIRLQGIDTAEIFHPLNTAERNHGMAAKARVQDLILNQPILIKTFKDAETFGRYVAQVYYQRAKAEGGWEWHDLATQLRWEGLEKKASYA